MKILTLNPMGLTNANEGALYLGLKGDAPAVPPEYSFVGATVTPCRRPPWLSPTGPMVCPLPGLASVSVSLDFMGSHFALTLFPGVGCQWSGVQFPLGITIDLIPAVGYSLFIVNQFTLRNDLQLHAKFRSPPFRCMAGHNADREHVHDTLSKMYRVLQRTPACARAPAGGAGHA